MDDNELRTFAEKLEGESNGSIASVEFDPGWPLIELTANRSGQLQMAAACLRTATEPIVPSEGRSKSFDFRYPQEQQNDRPFVNITLRRAEEWPLPKTTFRQQIVDRVSLLTCGVIGVAFVFVIVAGILAIVELF